MSAMNSIQSPTPVDQAKADFRLEVKRAMMHFVIKSMTVIVTSSLVLLFQYFDWKPKTVIIDIIEDIIQIEFERSTPTPTPIVTQQPSPLPTSKPISSSLIIVTPSPSSIPTAIATTVPTIAPTIVPVVNPLPLYIPTPSVRCVNLLSPKNGGLVVGARPNLQWEAITLQPGCNFRVRLRHQVTNEESYHITTTYSWVPHDMNMPAAKYGIWEWQVQVIDVGGSVLAESEVRQFHYMP